RPRVGLVNYDGRRTQALASQTARARGVGQGHAGPAPGWPRFMSIHSPADTSGPSHSANSVGTTLRWPKKYASMRSPDLPGASPLHSSRKYGRPRRIGDMKHPEVRRPTALVPLSFGRRAREECAETPPVSKARRHSRRSPARWRRDALLLLAGDRVEGPERVLHVDRRLPRTCIVADGAFVLVGLHLVSHLPVRHLDGARAPVASPG